MQLWSIEMLNICNRKEDLKQTQTLPRLSLEG